MLYLDIVFNTECQYWIKTKRGFPGVSLASNGMIVAIKRYSYINSAYESLIIITRYIRNGVEALVTGRYYSNVMVIYTIKVR